MFDQRDVDRFNSSQRYVDRFFKHVDSVASSAEEQIELAMNIVIQCFKFRKETRMAGEEPLLLPAYSMVRFSYGDGDDHRVIHQHLIQIFWLQTSSTPSCWTSTKSGALSSTTAATRTASGCSFSGCGRTPSPRIRWKT